MARSRRDLCDLGKISVKILRGYYPSNLFLQLTQFWELRMMSLDQSRANKNIWWIMKHLLTSFSTNQNVQFLYSPLEIVSRGQYRNYIRIGHSRLLRIVDAAVVAMITSRSDWLTKIYFTSNLSYSRWWWQLYMKTKTIKQSIGKHFPPIFFRKKVVSFGLCPTRSLSML